MPCSLPQPGHIGAALRWSEEIHTCKFVAKGAAVESPLEPLDDSDGYRIHESILSDKACKVKRHFGQELCQVRSDSR